MSVVLADLVPALLAGLVVWAAVHRWPALDPGGPRLSAARVERDVDVHPSLRRIVRKRLDPREVMGGLLAVALVLAVAMVTIVGLVAVMIRTQRGLARLDARAALWGAEHANHGATTFLRAVTMLGSTAWGLVLVAAVVAFEVRRRSSRAVLAFLVLVVIGQSVIVNITKVLVSRARPDYDRLTGVSSWSFPSGHSAQSAAAFAACALVLGRGRSRRVRSVLTAVAVAVAVAVAGSRVLLGVHWLTDVVAGLAVGWGWFAVVSVAFGGRWLRFAAPVEHAQAQVSVSESTAGRVADPAGGGSS